MIGKTISQYYILGELGRGGMGVVYKAEDTRLKRTVALKFLPPHLTKDEEANARFITEAQAASALDHQNICTIFDIKETDDDQMFIVMAYYEGETLREKISSGSGSKRSGGQQASSSPLGRGKGWVSSKNDGSGLEIAETIDITSQIAAGLARAHEAGIIHRDIKPSNIMITERGEVKILDFGIARIAGQKAITKTGSTLGTVAYMSPEQVRGEQTDHRTDIWSLGVVLYEMLTGQQPFDAEYDQAVMYSICNQPHEPVFPTASGREDVPEALGQIVDKALAKKADERYQEVDEMLSDLKEANAPVGILTQTPILKKRMATRVGRKRVFNIGVPILLMVLTALIILKFIPRQTASLTDTSKSAIAVLPFSVRGSDDIAYLKEGMVDLLSTKLDGAGLLRCVDPRSLLSFEARQDADPIDPETGRAAATHFGAGRYLLGNILAAGDHLQISASLYETDANIQRPVQVTVEGEMNQIFRLVDDLAAQFLTSFFGETNTGFVPISELTTQSLPALKAYLEGESILRKNAEGLNPSSDEAQAFRRAVTEDTSFAAAWFRLAKVLRQANYSESLQAMKKALRHSDGLSGRSRHHFRAFQAFLEGDAANAEQLYRAILGNHPDDVEAWHQLGELYIFSNWRRGRSVGDARKPLERALALDPQHWWALFHLGWISAHEGKWEERYALRKRLGKKGRQLIFRVKRAFARNDKVEQEKIIAELNFASDFDATACALMVAVIPDFRSAKRIANLVTASTRSPEVQGLGHIILAYLEAAQGRWHAAQSELASAESHNPALALEYRAYLAATPFLPVEKSEFRAVREKLAHWNANAVRPGESPVVFLRVHDVLHPFLKPYLLGLMSARLGELDKTLQYATQLDSMAGPDYEVALARDYAYSLRAQVALAQGRKKDALAEFEKAQMKSRMDKAVWTSFYQQIHERFLRAELLEEMNRDEEALGWYESFGWSSGYDFIYFAHMHFHRGEIYERLGQTEKAIEHYSKFVKLWQDCDPELRPQVVEAVARIAELQKR